ncbi:MAG: ABC transporter permease [Candidatus Aminicenantaceae bacterium]
MSAEKKSTSSRQYGASPRLARWLLARLTVYRNQHSIFEDFEETYSEICQSDSRLKARRWYWAQTFKSMPEYLKVVVAWKTVMLKNYLKIAFRNLWGRKLFSFINVFGLAVGLSICIIIFLWVKQELSYDHFHENADRLYRVERRIWRDSLQSRWPITGGAYRQALLDDIPEIEDAARLWGMAFSVKDHQNTVHEQSLFAVDNSVFHMFDFGLEKGDERTALKEPKTVVLSRQNAVKYFGTEDVVGRSLPMEWNEEMVDFKVTGILKAVPEFSHIHFDMLMSITSFSEDRFTNWRSNYLYTYVLLREGTSVMALNEKFRSFVKRRLMPEYGDIEEVTGQPDPLSVVLFPITDIHLHPSVNWEVEPGGSMNSVYVFTTVAIFILILACINFINLSTARAGKRAKEVSLRKTIGAGRGQLRGQFIQESVLSALLSLAVAVVLCSLFIPLFNQVFVQGLSADILLQPANLALLIGITIAVGVLSGLYPAFYLTRFDPIQVLKGGLHSGSGRSVFRKNMVIFQFVVSTVLIIGMFIVYNQMRYIQTRSLGFKKDNLVVIQARSQQIPQGFESFRSELMQNARIVSVAAAFDMPGNAFFSNGDFYSREEGEQFVDLIRIQCGFDYVENLEMEILAGRGFSREFGADSSETTTSSGAASSASISTPPASAESGSIPPILLNEAAVRTIGWTPEEAIGKKIDRGGPETEFQVIGVVRDFNFKSLRREVQSAALMLAPDEIRVVAVRIRPSDYDDQEAVQNTLGFIKQKWESTFPGEQFEYSFLGDRINELYRGEQTMQNIFVVFTALSILVGCLGLFGLAAFTAETRTKEIGIRKTLGASSGSVTLLLSREFIKWILLANVVAWPAAYYLMNRWLMNFAYRINISLGVFLLSLLIILSVSLGTIIVQTLRAAIANPVDSLRYE